MIHIYNRGDKVICIKPHISYDVGKVYTLESCRTAVHLFDEMKQYEDVLSIESKCLVVMVPGEKDPSMCSWLYHSSVYHCFKPYYKYKEHLPSWL